MFTSDIIGVLAIRKGSKGVVDKNRKLFNGVPLYSIALNRFEHLGIPYVLTTDYELNELKNVDSKNYLRRDNQLAQDNSHIFNVLEDVIIKRNLEDKIIVLVQATSPLIKPFHIMEALELYLKNDSECMVASVVSTQKEILKQGVIVDGIFNPINKSEYCFSNRQELPQTYKISGGVYVFSASSFIKFKGMHKLKIIPMIIDSKYALDIDNEKDLVYENWKT